MHTHAEEFLKENMEFESSSFPSCFESEQQSAHDIPTLSSDSSKLPEERQEENVDAAGAYSSISGGNVLQESNGSSASSTRVPRPSSENSLRSPNSYKPGTGREEEITAIEQFERGVYVTVVILPSGSKVFKRVRFRYELLANTTNFHIYIVCINMLCTYCPLF